MKKNYIFFALLLTTLFSSKLDAQVPNGGFENWFNNYLYSDLPPYITSNFQAFLVTGQGNVTEVAGVNGSAVRLETFNDEADTIPGTLILANAEDGNFAASHPFASTPDSITGYFRYSIPPGDTASILLIFTSSTFPVNFATVSIIGESPNFAYHAFEIPDFFLTPDSIIAIISSSSLDQPMTGGWIEIDDLNFTSSADQLPNYEFEDWIDIVAEDPEEWNTINYVSLLSGSLLSATKSTDSHSGNFALRLESVEISFFGNEPDTIGFVSTGFVGDEEIEGGFPYSGQPDKLSGFYKYTPVGNDTAVVNLAFSKYNSGTGETDSLFEQTVYLPASADYIPFEIPINLAEIPDTANVTIGSSNYAVDGSFIGLGSVLFIDDIQFEFIDGTTVPLFSEKAKLYPNPANDYTTLDLNSINGEIHSIQFFDALGRKVIDLENSQALGNTLNINTSKLNEGIYWYLIKTTEGAYSGSLQIER